ncbi:MAG TPA: bile acid:sodium symporter [Rectinemataceae bacterium]|nr:bile acid:sodium symporter [Rectinemataceae bacterium]
MLKLVAKNLKDNLLWYSLAAIALGWGLGLLAPSAVAGSQKAISVASTIVVFFMVYPMMVNLDLGKLPGAVRNPKPIVLSLIFNYVVTPLISWVLARLFFQNHPEIALGFWLVMLIPGSSMSLGYTGLSKGDIGLGAVALGANFLLAPFALPVFLHFLGASYNVPVPIGDLLKTIVLVLILPMILGDLTRRLILRNSGKEGFGRAQPLFALVTIAGMLVIVALIFFSKSAVLATQWRMLIPLAVVTLLYLAVQFPFITFINRALGLSYEQHMAIAFLSTGKNNGTAIAIAVLAFSPLVAIPAATLPLFQIIFSILYVQLAPRIRGRWNISADSPRP